MDDQRRLITSLGLPFVETHISYVLFGGGTAYKVKKAVRFPFLDFTTLAGREFYCREELRLNGRLAPAIYLDVVPITGTADAPVIGGRGTPIEYAVRMREFDQNGLLSRVIARDELTAERVDALAAEVASFHDHTARAAADSPFATEARILSDARDNFSALAGDTVPDSAAHLAALRDWTEREAVRCAAAFGTRRRDGFVRECHGDLHLGNIALVDDHVTLFDCIEFNPAMRWIDVMSDVAFLVMDLRDRHRPDLAARFLNAYLGHTGDYAGLAVLRFYVVYRALVRAKIERLRGANTECRAYVDLAAGEISPARPSLVITHGVTGSGKSTRAQALVEAGAIAVRSDVERKRLRGLAANARTASQRGGGIYTQDMTLQTYERLADLARTILAAGYTAVADATFLQRGQRDLLRGVARERDVPFVIADCAAPVAALRERVTRRLEHEHDASEATLDVLDHQLETQEPLGADELPYLAPGP
jgi:aminoglycoside phosphotransferase family enzyme/predicted kinase